MTEERSKGLGFEEPPPKHRVAYDWPAIAKRCRRTPMKWFKVFEKDKTTKNTAITAGNITALRPVDGFETRTANNDKGPPRTCTLYVRYNPEKDRSKQDAATNHR